MRYILETNLGHKATVSYVCYGIMKYLDEVSIGGYWHARMTRHEDSDGHLPMFHEFGHSANIKSITLDATSLGNGKCRITPSMLEAPIFKNIEYVDKTFKMDDLTKKMCDEIFIPLFIVRNNLSDALSCFKFFKEAVPELSDAQAFILGGIFYTYLNVNKGRLIYLRNDDDAILDYGRVSDLHNLLSLEEPKWCDIQWGSLRRGYPNYSDRENMPRTPRDNFRSTLADALLGKEKKEGDPLLQGNDSDQFVQFVKDYFISK